MGSETVREAIALARILSSQPDRLSAVRLRENNSVVVIERGKAGAEGELVAVRLLPEQRTALGRLKHEKGRTRWQPSNPRWGARDVRPGSLQIIGRVISVVHPLRQNGQSKTSRAAIRPD